MKKRLTLLTLVLLSVTGCTSVRQIKKIELHYGYTELNGGKIKFVEYDTVYNHK